MELATKAALSGVALGQSMAATMFAFSNEQKKTAPATSRPRRATTRRGVQYGRRRLIVERAALPMVRSRTAQKNHVHAGVSESVTLPKWKLRGETMVDAHHARKQRFTAISITDEERGMAWGFRTAGSLRGFHFSNRSVFALLRSRTAKTRVTTPSEQKRLVHKPPKLTVVQRCACIPSAALTRAKSQTSAAGTRMQSA